MSSFRSSLFIAIVSLFVLTGYAWNVVDHCCEANVAAQLEGHSQPSEKVPAHQDGECKCICHQIFSGPEVAPSRLAPFAVPPRTYVALTDEFPPDTVPLGIDYPPQLA